MHIISGSAKGRALKYESKNLRPTSQKVREALFNILSDSVDGSTFLDLCAGSGAVGLEAVSRGAKHAWLVDTQTRLIVENVGHLGMQDQVRLIRKDALQTLTWLEKQEQRFDLIFVDPPYDDRILDKLLLRLGNGKILAPSARVIAEHRKQHTLQQEYGLLKCIRQEKYGETVLSFYMTT